MVDVFTEVVIHKPLDVVAEYAANPDNAPEWYVKIDSAEWITPKPLQVGSQIDFKANFLGKKLNYTYEIIKFNPLKELVMRTAEGPFPMETTYIWEKESESSTRMKLRNAGQPSGFSKVVTPFISLMMKKANREDLNKLKALLEKQ